MVGCRANEIENLLTAELRVESKKEKKRYLKFITATKRGEKKKKNGDKETPRVSMCEPVKFSSMQCTPQQRNVLGLTSTLTQFPFRII